MVPGQEEDRLPVGAPRELPPQDQNIKPPRSGDAGEQGVFDAGVAGVLAGKPGVEELAALEELAHEAYWGVKIAETRGVVGGLAEVAGRVGQAEVVRALAARVLGSALANNPRALKGVERGVVGRLAKGLVGGEVAVLRVLFAVGKVLGKAEVRGEFLEMGGVGVLARVFAEGGERVRGRVAVVVEDAFLNGEMRVGEVVEEVGGLEALCKVFEEGVVGMVEEDQAARVLGALGRLRERVGCVQGRDFDAWVGKGGWGEEMEAVVGEWKEKFAVSAKEEL